MRQAAIYVRDPLPVPGSIISKEDQETGCREYCQARGLTVPPPAHPPSAAQLRLTRR